ncbi:MAG: hypothetical protein KBH07_09380 [Flavobacteriales bacterium]|nr:hypothetical protein [Flavobacteriales bacterium]MBP9080898.1 hypothetical protein [Flavobacteriales bacterium]
MAASCTWTGKASRSITPGDITLLTDLPRGGVFTDANGTTLGYRIFRIHITNNSTAPAGLTMDLPGGPVRLLPDTGRYVRVFLFPDDISPDTAQDTFDFGIQGSVDFLTAPPPSPTPQRRSLAPGTTRILYIGVVFEQGGLEGIGRGELFIKGQRPIATSFPEGSIPASTSKGNDLTLLFGLAIDPPKHYALIPCGRIAFEGVRGR